MGGLVFGDYRLIRLLTRGTSAEIYLALNEHNPELPHELALKKLLPRGSAPADLRPRLPSLLALTATNDH